LSFSGKPAHLVTPGQIGPSTHHPARFTADRMRRLIGAAHERLQGVHIECLDWRVFITRYDRPRTLFYLDPPYLGAPRRRVSLVEEGTTQTVVGLIW